MDSTFFSSNYRQYKKDTEYIAGWLAETSQKAGYQRASEPVPPKPEQSTPRLKGKARKEAKSAAAAATTQTAAPYRINVGEFIPMAEAIAEKLPKVQVPGALTKLFSRAIEARQRAAKWFKASHDHTVADESNQTHAHFVTILQQASGILQPLVKENLPQHGSHGKSRQNPKPATMQETTNAFSSLNVEDPDVSDDLEEEIDLTAKGEELLKSLPSVAPVEVQQDESEVEAEFFFAIHSFITNLHELRDIVQETWFEYKDKKVESIKASLIANTAIDLVRHAEAEFDLLLKRPQKYPAKQFPVWTLPALLFSSQHPWTTYGNTIEEFLFPSGIMIPKEHDCSQVHWCFWPVYAALKYYLDAVMSAKKPKTDIPIIAESVFDPVGGAHQDSLRTVALASNFRHVILRHKSRVAVDEVTRGMAHMFRYREVPIWATFGIQILLDIQDILTPPHLEDPFRELQDHVERQIAAKEALARISSLSPFRYDKRVQKIRQDIEEDLKFTREVVKNDNCNTLKHNPIRCGLMKYDVYLQLHNSGLDYEFATGEIGMMAHLYVATRLLDPEAPKWPDMEFMVYQQDQNRMFFGGLPKTLGESNRKMQLLLGRSAMDVARNSRKKKQQQNAKVKLGRWIQETSMLAPIFTTRSSGFATTNESVDMQVTRLNNLLRSSTEHTRLARKLNVPTIWVEFELQKRRWRPYIEEHSDNENGPTALLRDLAMWLEGDAVDLYFDWQALHIQCMRIWDSLVRSLLDMPDWDNRVSVNIGLAEYIIRLAAEDEEEWGTIAKDDVDFAPSLRKALEAIQANILEVQDEGSGFKMRGGDVCLTQLLGETTVFANNIKGDDAGSIEEMYGNWPEETLHEACAYKLFDLVRQKQQAELMTKLMQSASFFSSDEEDDYDPCANCPRCKRRTFLGHRYVGHYQHQEHEDHQDCEDHDHSYGEEDA